MYKTHALACQDYALQSPDNFMDTAVMVSLSIQQKWSHVGRQMFDVRQNSDRSRFLWGNKGKTYKHLASHKHKLYAQTLAIANSYKTDDEKALSLMKSYLRIKGLGVPKAGFLCQLTLGLVGCMDTHNLKRYGLDEKMFKLNPEPKTPKALDSNTQKLIQYINLCHGIGTENLWDTWCNSLSETSSFWRDGHHVSESHYHYLSGE